MCLNSIQLNLVKRNGEFVGKGYKKLPREAVKNGKLVTDQCKGKRWSRNWMKSHGVGLENTVHGTSYTPGFHIFLNKEDAEDYMYNKDGIIVEVAFKEVISFGENEVKWNGKDNSYKYGPCVVANQMKITKILDE